MKLKTKIFIVLTLWSLTYDYYSSQETQQQFIQQKKESEEIQKLLNETSELLKKITNNKYHYNDLFLSIGINKKGKTYVGLLRVSNRPYYHIIISNKGEICFYNKNGTLYKSYNLFGGKKIEISNPSDKEKDAINNSENNNDYIIDLLKKEYENLVKPIQNLLEEQGESTHEERKAILKEVIEKLQNISQNENISKIKELLNETSELVNSIFDDQYCYNDGFLSMETNDEGKTYVQLLRDSNTPYYHITISNDGYIYFYDQNVTLYKKYNLFGGIELGISNPTEKEKDAINDSENNNYIINLLTQSTHKDLEEPIKNLLKEQGESTHKDREKILEEVKAKLNEIKNDKSQEIQDIKRLFCEMITELTNNIKRNECNIVGQWQSYNYGIFLQNDKNIITIDNNSDILFYYKDNYEDNNNQDKKDIQYISYKGINLLGGGIWRDQKYIDNIKQNDEDIKKLLKEEGGDIREDIIKLLKIEKTTVDFETRQEVLKSIIKTLKEKNKNEGLIDAESAGGSAESAGGGSAGGSAKSPGGSTESAGGAGKEKEKEKETIILEKEGEKIPKIKAKSKWKTWIIGIVVLSSVVFLLLSIYGISRKEDDEKVNTEKNSTVKTQKDTQIEPINIKEDNKTDNEEDNTTDIEEDNTTDSEEDCTDDEIN